MNGQYRRKPGVTRAALLEQLQKEADMDGLVIVSCRELGQAVGVCHATVYEHLEVLQDQGSIKITRHSTYNQNMNEIQLSEGLY